MKTYLLLRSNRESGPYSLEALLQMGLKPYDLIWVEGRSAAWRYPSEIEELKAYAPAVEEQPFDRFFRREPETAAEPVQPKQASRPVFSDYESRFLPSENQQPAKVGRKSVFVTLPTQPQRSAPPSRPTEVPEKSAGSIHPEPVRTPLEEPETPTVKFAQPLDDIKAMYVQSLQERRHRTARSRLLRQYGRQAALFLGLLGAGVALGFMVLKKPADTPAQNNVGQQINEPVADNPVDAPVVLNDMAEEAPAEKMPAEAADQSIIRDYSAEQIRQNRVALQTPDPKQKFQESANNGKTTVQSQKQEQKAESSSDSPSYGYEPSQHIASTGERVKASRSEANETNETTVPDTKSKTGKVTGSNGDLAATIPAEFAGKVTVESNEYKKVALGGIRDLRLSVTNSSDAALTKVVVQLQYLRPNEEPLKTEMVNFRGVGAKETSTIRLPDTNRGTKVRYRIIEVQP